MSLSKDKWTKPLETNRPTGETPQFCWDSIRQAKRNLGWGNEKKDKKIFWILQLREHEEHFGYELTPFSEYNLTKDDIQNYYISDPKRTAKMLHGYLVTTINQEIKKATLEIKEKYRKKLDEYRGNDRGRKR